MNEEKIDLLKLVDQGGCSAKLPAAKLQEALADLPLPVSPEVLVNIGTHDDAGVYKISDDIALIQTTDFFPPVCSDPYDFGQVAAANALSDVYAMGGRVLSVLNIVLFPATLPLKILKEILRGGGDIVTKAGGFVLGGHTIANDIPVYGLAVTGTVHPERVTTNSNAKPGDVLILTKPLGTGVIIAGKKNSLVQEDAYNHALETMKQLNAPGATIMNQFHIKTATDVTGYGLIGHVKKMADASDVSIRIHSKHVPALPHARELIEMGCIPGASFRNKEFALPDCYFDKSVDYNSMMLLFDAQTSGGLIMAVPPAVADIVIGELRSRGFHSSTIVGEVIEKETKSVLIV